MAIVPLIQSRGKGWFQGLYLIATITQKTVELRRPRNQYFSQLVMSSELSQTGEVPHHTQWSPELQEFSPDLVLGAYNVSSLPSLPLSATQTGDPWG